MDKINKKALALLLLAALGGCGVAIAAGFFQNVQLADVKVNDGGINYFTASRYPVKYWHFNQGPTSQLAGNAKPAMHGTTNRELDIPIPPYNADAGTGSSIGWYSQQFDWLGTPSPSPTVGAACTQEGRQILVSGHATSNTTQIACCYSGGSLKYVRGVCQ